MRNFLCIVCIVIKSSWTTTMQMNADDFPPRTQLQAIDGPYNGGSKPFSADRKIHLLETKTTACCLQKPRWHPLFFCGALRAIGFLSFKQKGVWNDPYRHPKHMLWFGIWTPEKTPKTPKSEEEKSLDVCRSGWMTRTEPTRFDPLHLWMVNGIATSHLEKTCVVVGVGLDFWICRSPPKRTWL